MHRTHVELAAEAQQARARQGKRSLHTGSKEWRELRARVMREQPLCCDCEAEGKARAGKEVDHDDGDATNNARANLKSRCKSHHSRKTARENGAFGRKRKP